MTDLEQSPFWRHKRVLLTGHTGFKGSWAALWLEGMGARITGLALPPETPLFGQLAPWNKVTNHSCDLRDVESVAAIVRECAPEIVIHMAAQALVRRSYRQPLDTFGVNVTGTVVLLDLLRQLPSPPNAVLVVTSDKVYHNEPGSRAFAETERLGGDDPYSASKACVELVVNCYRESFFKHTGTAIATARAGNVVGGGDHSQDRLIPDFIRSVANGTQFVLRNPDARRPWQHVLDVLTGYFSYAEALAGGKFMPLSINFGPPPEHCVAASVIIARMERAMGIVVQREAAQPSLFAEKQVLEVDARLAASALDWRPRLNLEASLDWSAAWYRAAMNGEDMRVFSLRQIGSYAKMRV